MFLLASAGCIATLHVTTPATITTDTIAPEFTLFAATGRPVSLSTELARGPVVLVFYRGYW